ncbi:MAG: HAMP domain-containing sensor histidine kinase [Bacteroidota bacterium]
MCRPVRYWVEGIILSSQQAAAQRLDETELQSFAHFWDVHGALTTSSLLFTALLVAFLVMSRHKHKAQNSALKTLNEALATAQEKAEESDKLKTSILRNMSHEVRTPLNAIMGYADLIASRDGNVSEMAERITMSSLRLKETFETVIELAALEGGIVPIENQTVDLDQLIDDTFEALSETAEAKSITLRKETAPEGITIMSDPQALKRALLPIVQNAIQFSDAGCVHVHVDPTDTQAVIVVKDSGIGMSPEFVKHACEPFKQESTGLGRRYEGSGLGLSLASQLIALLGGEMSIASKRAEGCTVTITLPRRG